MHEIQVLIFLDYQTSKNGCWGEEGCMKNSESIFHLNTNKNIASDDCITLVDFSGQISMKKLEYNHILSSPSLPSPFNCDHKTRFQPSQKKSLFAELL